MGGPKRLKKSARLLPGLGKVLKEKEQLYQLSIRQKDHIDNLERALYEKKHKKRDPIWPLLKAEILQTEKHGPVSRPSAKHASPFIFNWVVPAFSSSSGGQADIFRTIKFLTQKGHTCRIYIFDPTENSSLKEQKGMINNRFKGVASQVFYNSTRMADCDAIFATHWLTAYPVFNFEGQGKKYYYAQGYEPHTQPEGYLNFLAEKTYSFGFKGIVLGEWLAEKLGKGYKMECEYFDFGYDQVEYFTNGDRPRKDVLFYAQPSKAHRGFELGIMALEIFHAKNPTSKIHLFGEDVSQHKIGFPYINHGVLTVSELNNLYNQCSAGLSLSFTNISLIPLEMIAAGCQPVINDAYQTKMIKYKKLVIYAKQDPLAIAAALDKAVRGNPRGLKNRLSETFSWDYSNQRVEEILIRDLS